MNVHPAELVIAIQLVQCIASIVLAGLLVAFFRAFRQTFLRHWALSVSALAFYLAASSASLAMDWTGSDWQLTRFAISALALAVAYPHVVWLMMGSFEALKGRSLPRRSEWWLISAAAVFGLATALVAPFDPASVELRTLMRIELRYALTGTAFLVAGIVLWRAQRGRGLLGARLGSIGFCLSGLQMLHVAGINLWMRLDGSPPFYIGYVGLLDFLFQSLIALGIVVWLLEIQRRRTQQVNSELTHVRQHDASTGLPNRSLVTRQLEALMQQRGPDRIAVISIGVNRFALVNQALGWQQAELMMGRIAARVHTKLNRRCLLGRLSERDFLVLRPTLDSPEAIVDWTEKLIASISRPIEVDGQDVHVSLCAGISIYPDDGTHAETLAQRSQHALVRSARIGRDVTLFHQLSKQETDDGEIRLRLETELRRALADNQFEMHYQPIVALADRSVVGFEALLRWRHPEHGLLSPDAFLDQAASIGLLVDLEARAQELALFQLASWQDDRSRRGLHMSVNFSAMKFQQPDLVDSVLKKCREYGIDPARLQIEITENTAIRDLQGGVDNIHAFQRQGVRIALDDFGTGYSSLAHLRELDVDLIKLDRMFLDHLDDDPRQRELVSAMIGLGHSLGKKIVAEGVENQTQLDFLAECGCDFVQGFLLQKPRAADLCRFQVHALPARG